MKRWKILSGLWLPFSESTVSRDAAAASFYILLSLLPATALGLTIFALLPISLPAVLEAFLPKRLYPVIEYVLSAIVPYHPAALLSIWAILTLWSASKGVMAISDGIYSIRSTNNHRSFIHRRLNAMLSFAILAIILVLVLTFHVFGGWLLSQLTAVHPNRANVMNTLYRLRHLYSLFILSFLLACLYWILSGKSYSFRQCLFSGFLTAIGWTAATVGFSVYVNHIQSYQRLYGGLGLLLLSCLWLQICIGILLYSVVLTNLIQEKRYHPFKIIRNAFGQI